MRCVQLGLVVVCLQGCLTERARERGRDRDGDGHHAWQLDGSDCDDENPAVNPDRPELCGNLIDDNCDGLVDDFGEGNVTWFADADSDGFTGSSIDEGCVIPVGGVFERSDFVDCDDGDAAINPSADEVWYDNVDQDCDGNDQDQDGDGALLANDCDDLDSTVHPGALEICNNGKDDDCSGPASGDCGFAMTQDLASKRYTLLPGQSVLGIADQNQDGNKDILVLNDGDSLLYLGPFESPLLRLADASARVQASGGFGCRLSWLFGESEMSLVCGDFLGEQVRYDSPPITADQSLSEMPVLVEAPVNVEPTGLFRFGTSVFSANDNTTNQSLLMVQTGRYETDLGNPAFEAGVYVYGLRTSYPMAASSERGGPFNLDDDFMTRRPFLLSETEQHIITFEKLDSQGQISIATSVDGMWESQPLVISSLGEMVGHSQPADVNQDGELDLLSVATRPLSGGAVESIVSLHNGPFGSPVGSPHDVNGPSVGFVVRNGAVEGGEILAAELCDVTGDEEKEVVVSVGQVVDGRPSVDLVMYDLESSEQLFEVRSGGFVVGCTDFDGNGTDDIVATDLTQSWILYSDLD